MRTATAPPRHLLSVSDLGRDGLLEVLDLSEHFAEVAERPIPKVPALRGKTVVTAFFEASTRTRLSFDMAAKRLSADTMTFAPGGSSLEKGESLRDTVETIDAMGVDAIVVRHSASGAPARIASWVDAAVVNAGDGQHEHPTQALLDCYTLREAIRAERADATIEDLSGLTVAIVGDVAHSRVARSGVAAFSALGARVILVAPRPLLPASLSGWPVEVTSDLDAVLGEIDVCYLLRLQAERITEALIPELGEYTARFCLTGARRARLKSGAFVMHPGPMNRGVEIDAEVAGAPGSLITRQVRNGVIVRTAVLFYLLGPPRPRLAAGEMTLDQLLDAPLGSPVD